MGELAGKAAMQPRNYATMQKGVFQMFWLFSM
jgi:hypothetical protein